MLRRHQQKNRPANRAVEVRDAGSGFLLERFDRKFPAFVVVQPAPLLFRFVVLFSHKTLLCRYDSIG
jgi:hypothetical protein